MVEELKVEGYCVKCKTKRQMKNAKKVTLPNGRHAAQGVCPECGTKMFRIGDPAKAKWLVLIFISFLSVLMKDAETFKYLL